MFLWIVAAWRKNSFEITATRKYFSDSGLAHRIVRNLASLKFSPTSSESHYLGVFHPNTHAHSSSSHRSLPALPLCALLLPLWANQPLTPAFYPETSLGIRRNLCIWWHASWMAMSGILLMMKAVMSGSYLLLAQTPCDMSLRNGVHVLAVGRLYLHDFRLNILTQVST